MITGTILARNEAENIVECARSLRPHVTQLFLIDMESTDETVERARPIVDRVFSHRHVSNFDAARNIVASEGPNEWFWFLDADERVPERTGQLINQIVREQGDAFEAINIPFKTYFCGRWIEHSGWWPGYTMSRVLKRGHFRFSERLHGGVEVDGREVRLPPDAALGIDHFSYRSIEHYLEKLNRYTSTEAQQMLAEGRPSTWEDCLRQMMHDLWMYYEANHGHLDEEHGWILAWLSGQYRWLQHAKQLDLNPQHQGGHPASLDDALGVMRDELARMRARAKRPDLPLGIVWRSPLWDPSGYAEEGRTLLKALARGERELLAEEIPWNDSSSGVSESDASLIRTLQRTERPRHSIAITDCITTLVEPDPKAAVNVLRTTFETDRIPAEWRESLDRFDQIWVISRHNYEAFRRSWVPPEKLRVVPSCLDVERFANPSGTVELPEAMRGRFVFLSIFDWQLRKGWDVLLRAWCQAFRAEDGAGLLIKITRNHGLTLEQVRGQANRCLSEVGHSLASRPDIVVTDEPCDGEQIVSLYHACDTFVLPSRGEGWGRPYMEAMAAGLPVIATQGSGQSDFLTPENSFLIRAEETTVSAEAAREMPHYTGHRWQEPDETHLAELLKECRSNQTAREEKVERASDDVGRKWDLAAARSGFEEAVRAIESQLAPAAPAAIGQEQVKVRWEGEFFAGHSFSSINEALAREFTRADHIGISIKRVFHNPPVEASPLRTRGLEAYIDRPLDGPADVTVRHAFPPNWEPPEGKWVHIQPWEFGHLPQEWIEPLRDRVDEIWAPSTYVKRVYERSGIPGEKIHVIPWGVDSDVFTPAATPLLLPTEKSFVFLFVGGTLRRKGIDTLLEAFRSEFSPADDVCLCIKDMGTGSFYRYGNYRDQILRAKDDPGSPEILYFDEFLTAGQMASLYTACDALVMPYRGEGFGLPILEAMACGLPVIVPRGGASDDFVPTETGYLLASTEVETQHDWLLAGPALELEVSVSDVRSAMRRVFEDRDDRLRRSRLAAEHARQYTWTETARRMTGRLESLGRGIAAGESVPGVTACIATQDCEAVLPRCLAHLTPYVDQVLVLDSHSRDRTLAVAREYGAAVEEHCAPQESKHRLMHRSLDWVFWLEPDDVLEESDAEAIRSLLNAQSPLISEVTMRRQDGSALKFFRANGNGHGRQGVSP